jgi:hypothetical protein
MSFGKPVAYSPEIAIAHPLGVRPSGNLYLESDIEKIIAFRANSLGLFAFLQEELLVEVLGFCSGEDLNTLSRVSHYMRAFSHHHDVWRDLVTAQFLMDKHREIYIDFFDSWRETYWKFVEKLSDTTTVIKKTRRYHIDQSSRLTPCRNVFSDILFGPYRASGLCPTARWLNRENIDRVHWTKLTQEEFVSQYESKNKPVIITGLIEDIWPDIYASWQSIDGMIKMSFPTDPLMECGPLSVRLSEINSYMSSNLSRLDEAPIFVFDTSTFGNTVQYPHIPLFGKDLFDLLSPPYRPDHKWLLVGGHKASSKWHVDPNSTNAWNAVINGEKKWILTPTAPPGVQVSNDGFAVRQPLTLTDYLDSGYYSDMHEQLKSVVEATCKAGEIVFVPRGWWHCVMNTASETIAITQNYAAESSINSVRRFLKKMSHCVSGIVPQYRSSLWQEFDSCLSRNRPDLDIPQLDILTSECAVSGDVSPASSCCGGDVQEFSFWTHLGNRQMVFDRDS